MKIKAPSSLFLLFKICFETHSSFSRGNEGKDHLKVADFEQEKKGIHIQSTLYHISMICK